MRRRAGARSGGRGHDRVASGAKRGTLAVAAASGTARVLAPPFGPGREVRTAWGNSNHDGHGKAWPRHRVGGGTTGSKPIAGAPASGGPAGGVLVEDGRARDPPVQRQSAHLTKESDAPARRVTRVRAAGFRGQGRAGLAPDQWSASTSTGSVSSSDTGSSPSSDSSKAGSVSVTALRSSARRSR
jgi:hypothetical protein